jgi:outer membrane protein
MRKIFAPMMAVAGLLAIAAPLSAQAPAKVGYLDTRRIIQEAPGAVDARTTLEREMQGFETRLQAMEDSMRTMTQDYQQRSLVMSAEAKQRREQEIMQKQQDFQRQAQEMQQQAQRRQQDLMEPIMQRVEQAISDVRKAEGFAIVFDAASEAIVSADPALDLTQKVIERLRTTASAAARAP